MKEYLLGIDIGTTSTKALLFDLDGNEISRAISTPYQNDTSIAGWVEQDPEQLWLAVISTITKVISKNKDKVTVIGICIAAQSGSLIPVDQNGDPVYPLITWMDGRSEEIISLWKDNGIENQVRLTSGWSLYPGLCLPTIAWLKKHNSLVFDSARYYFSVNDFVVFRLTGKKITNPSNAGGMQLVDISSGEWSEYLCNLAGIKKEQLSIIQPSGALIGEIKSEICNLTGISHGTVLINGGHDQGCTATGLGIIDPGKLLLACGTAWVFTGVLDRIGLKKLPSTLDLNFHTVPKRWTLSQSLGGLGASFEWWVKKAWLNESLHMSRSEMYSVLNEELSHTKYDNGLFFLPITGGHDNPATTKRGGFMGLQFGHTRADMARSIMEGAAYELRWALEAVQNAGLPVERLWMVGGAAQSPLWPEILANVTGIPILLPEYDNWPALGAALSAGVGVGVYENYEIALTHFHKPAVLIAPDVHQTEYYNAAFKRYKHYWQTFSL